MQCTGRCHEEQGLGATCGYMSAVAIHAGYASCVAWPCLLLHDAVSPRSLMYQLDIVPRHDSWERSPRYDVQSLDFLLLLPVWRCCRECPLCAPDFKRVLDICRNMKAGALKPDDFFSQLDASADGFAVVAEHFGRGIMNMTQQSMASQTAAAGAQAGGLAQL
eukprot:GHRQ01023024.1.p2 GENE.GHRQ01023024.1~~GHRQ01023024.1.p2  ORF type:complete len:163 (-),score=53.80 GHRQ01023024.1:439-927(-)